VDTHKPSVFNLLRRDLHLAEKSYTCSVEWVVKHLVSAQTLSPVAGGLYEGQLVVWDVTDAHNSVFTRETKFHIYGEPPVYLDHNYFAPPVGKIVHFSDREDGLYVALKLERPLEDVSGVYLSVGGFAKGETRADGVYEIKELAVFEASLTPLPAQPNSELVLLMKTLTDMTTENEKATVENTNAQATQKAEPGHISGQATQKVAPPPSALGYLRKQDLAQLEAFVNELAARVEALEQPLSAQLADLKRRVSDLEAAVSQIQGMTQEAVTQSVEKSLKAVMEQVQPLAKEMGKSVLLVADALKKVKTQSI
jgi:polyhydroxyalkanoate synthesis regulator phasin